jgi:hypothetical protein
MVVVAAFGQIRVRVMLVHILSIVLWQMFAQDENRGQRFQPRQVAPTGGCVIGSGLNESPQAGCQGD